MVDMAHIAGLVAGGVHQSPGALRRRGDHHHPQDPPGPPRRPDPSPTTQVLAKRINSAVFPGTQGGPLEHVIAGKAVCFGEALKPEFKEYARKIVGECPGHGSPAAGPGRPAGVGAGTDNHLMLVDLRKEECTGKELEARLDAVPHHRQQEHRPPARPASPFVTSTLR